MLAPKTKSLGFCNWKISEAKESFSFKSQCACTQRNPSSLAKLLKMLCQNPLGSSRLFRAKATLSLCMALQQTFLRSKKKKKVKSSKLPQRSDQTVLSACFSCNLSFEGSLNGDKMLSFQIWDLEVAGGVWCTFTKQFWGLKQILHFFLLKA